jgi:CobW/HypB/UreG, nucleotide-binding domain
MTGRLPLHILTGFLGSGKTTLLNRMLRNPVFADSATLIKEIGAIAIDHHLVRHIDRRETMDVVVLQGGCTCCTVRGDLVEALRALTAQRAQGGLPAFSRVILETTGLADPAPVLFTLAGDPMLRHKFVAGARSLQRSMPPMEPDSSSAFQKPQAGCRGRQPGHHQDRHRRGAESRKPDHRTGASQSGCGHRRHTKLGAVGVSARTARLARPMRCRARTCSKCEQGCRSQEARRAHAQCRRVGVQPGCTHRMVAIFGVAQPPAARTRREAPAFQSHAQRGGMERSRHAGWNSSSHPSPDPSARLTGRPALVPHRHHRPGPSHAARRALIARFFWRRIRCDKNQQLQRRRHDRVQDPSFLDKQGIFLTGTAFGYGIC